MLIIQGAWFDVYFLVIIYCQSLGDKNWKQKTSTTTQKNWYRLSGDYIEEIGFLSFNSIDISVNLGYTYYNTGQPYGLVLSNKFSEIYTVQIQPIYVCFLI